MVLHSPAHVLPNGGSPACCSRYACAHQKHSGDDSRRDRGTNCPDNWGANSCRHRTGCFYGGGDDRRHDRGTNCRDNCGANCSRHGTGDDRRRDRGTNICDNCGASCSRHGTGDDRLHDRGTNCRDNRGANRINDQGDDRCHDRGTPCRDNCGTNRSRRGIAEHSWDVGTGCRHDGSADPDHVLGARPHVVRLPGRFQGVEDQVVTGQEGVVLHHLQLALRRRVLRQCGRRGLQHCSHHSSTRHGRPEGGGHDHGSTIGVTQGADCRCGPLGGAGDRALRLRRWSGHG
mmetsp:Transcript_4812/g.15126  ORF Transcript_4812/g.15126 Transcript_4812/m.15126 type:complete len:288 (+) Transcript_4812:740-1603(+)